MKYDKSSIAQRAAYLGLSVLLTALIGCGASTPVKDIAEVEAAPEILPTNTYLPEDQFDKEGLKLPYIAAVNPYAMQEGKIDKESVALYIEARRAFKKGDYTTASAKLKILTERDGLLSGPFVMQGDIAVKQNNQEQAEALFRKAISVNPQNVNAYLRLAQLLRVQGKYIQSQNVYAETLALWKDFPEAHLNLGILYDIYLNKPLAGQQHMEAYQFLTDSKNLEVTEWLTEIRGRTGVEYSIKAGAEIEAPALPGTGEASIGKAVAGGESGGNN